MLAIIPLSEKDKKLQMNLSADYLDDMDMQGIFVFYGDKYALIPTHNNSTLIELLNTCTETREMLKQEEKQWED